MVYSRKELMNKKANVVKLNIPTWASRLYIILGLVLLPYTIYLGSTLPQHHLSTHWDISWTGLDIALVLSMICTGILAYTKSMWLIITASTTGSLLLVEAWFDVMSERGSYQLHQAILLAVAFEIPFALMSYYLAIHTIKYNKKEV
jgi:hypothetical protein